MKVSVKKSGTWLAQKAGPFLFHNKSAGSAQ
jgi:hypothetical protein